jgi:hypothetical protein
MTKKEEVIRSLDPGLKIAGVTDEENYCSDRKKQQSPKPSLV